MPEDWRTGLFVPIWKREEDAQFTGMYRGITLLGHIIKLLEGTLDKRLRERVDHVLSLLSGTLPIVLDTIVSMVRILYVSTNTYVQISHQVAIIENERLKRRRRN